MFYCEPCAKERDWPSDMWLPRSRGACEICKKIAACFDVSSRNLPVPKREPAVAKDPSCTCRTSGPDIEGPDEACPVHGRFRPGDWVLVYARVERHAGHPDDMLVRFESHNEDYTAAVRLDRVVMSTELPTWARLCTAMVAEDDGRYVRCEALERHAGWHTHGERQWDNRTTVGHIEDV
jgi:hypothetical protein